MSKKIDKTEMERFAAIWNDLKSFPAVTDVAAAFGVSRQTASVRARNCNAAGVACISRDMANNFLQRMARERNGK